MSKGNLFLGMGRGKVGDVVFYRADGEQITRSRNRHPRNPNTNAQIIQRAVMADVQRVYSLGYQLFNHAFQGYRVGAENQRRFIKVNADKIRKAVLAALNGSTSPVYLGAPGILSPVPNEYIVSEGNYDQTLLSIDATTPANPKWVLPSAGSATTIGEYAAAHGLVDGDIYTIVGIFTKSDTMDYEYFDADGQFVEEASVRKANFAYLQLRVKEGTQASTTAYSSSTQWDDIFDEAHGTTGSKTVAEGLDMVDISGIDGSGAWTVIRSRENEDLRSTSTLQLFGEQSGVTPEWLFRVWSKEATNLASDLTLEGGDFSPAGGSASPTLPDFVDGDYFVVAGTFGSSQLTEVTSPIVMLRHGTDRVDPWLVCKFDEQGDVYSPWIWDEGAPSSVSVDIDESQAQSLAVEISAYLAGKYSSDNVFETDNVTEVDLVSSESIKGTI